MSMFRYPIALDVEDELCLIVGGGAVASRKAAELASCGAEVKVISPRLSEPMEQLLAEGLIMAERREVRLEDVEDPFMVVVATDDPQVNEWVALRARRARALVNVVDQPDLCQFAAPSVLRRGSLTVAVSTGGASPALAARIREELEELIGSEWEVIMDRLNLWRRKLKDDYPDQPELRRHLMLEVARLDLVSLVRHAGVEGLNAKLDELLVGATAPEGSR
jgi:precorrin-2 dehydrogenase/sirohydrochlorin ferrochelatase